MDFGDDRLSRCYSKLINEKYLAMVNSDRRAVAGSLKVDLYIWGTEGRLSAYPGIAGMRRGSS